MKTSVAVLLCVTASTIGAHGVPIWINEIHYDNIGTDSGEFVEIAAPSSFTSLSTITLTLYNGANGASYGTQRTLDTFAVGGTSGGYTFYSFIFSTDGIQNGSPDGLALDQSGTVLQFLSYEGAFAAAGGPADGMTSIDIGVAESNTTTPSGYSLQLVGTGNQYSDFTWSGPLANTRGAVNTGQTFLPSTRAVPDSNSSALLLCIPLVGLFITRRFVPCAVELSKCADKSPTRSLDRLIRVRRNTIVPH